MYLGAFKGAGAAADKQGIGTAVTQDARMVSELNETHARCRLLFMEQRDRWVTRDRVDSISAGLNPLYSEHPPSDNERRALAWLGFAGWCWREAEHGDPAAVRDDVLGAYRAAVIEPKIEGPLVPAWASWKFLADGGRPGLASPGSTSDRRLAFLDAAFEKMNEAWGAPVGIDRKKARSAFNHGVVLNDVERLALNHAPLV
jgi:hypothetical protein